MTNINNPSNMQITVTDIRQFVYCPRVIYYTYVMPVDKKISYKMNYGKEQHLEIDKLEKRRKLKGYGFKEGRRIFHLPVQSTRLGLKGVIDMVIEVERGRLKEYYPVEFKNTLHQLQKNHKYQLVAYAMLLEDKFNKPVRKGFIYTIPSKNAEELIISENMRIYVKRIIGAVHNIIKYERFPEKRSARRCHDCEYKNYCGDVI